MYKVLYLHAGSELYGADIVLLELLKGLDKEQISPYVVLPSKGPLYQKLKDNGIEVSIVPYPILRRKYFNPVGIIKYLYSYFKYSKDLERICKNQDINLIHVNTAAVLEGIYLKQKLSVPIIWHIHEIIMNPVIIHKILSYLISHFADKVVTVSNATKSHLVETNLFTKNEISVIYNGVDNNKFNPNNKYDYLKKELKIPDDAIIVGMLGRVNSWKGQSDFLAAAEIFLKKNKHVYAVLVGGVFEGEEWRFEDLEKQISKMENRDRIILSDYRQDVPNIHAMYDIFVLPSINPDPLPTVVLEAMASGKPIVGYAHGGICEMVVDNYNGFIVDVRDYRQLASKIILLLQDDLKRNEMGRNSLTRQQTYFSIKSYVNNFLEVYNSQQ